MATGLRKAEPSKYTVCGGVLDENDGDRRMPVPEHRRAYQRGSDRRRFESPPPKPPLEAGFGRASLTVRLRPPI